jgi:hypothetical protein
MHLFTVTPQKKALTAYVALLLLTLLFLLRIGYTTSDDVQIALGSFSDGYKNAISAGRLTWVLAMPSTLWSEPQGSIWFTKILRILWVFALFHAAYLVLKNQLKTLSAVFILVFPLVFFVNGWDHHAFSSYPGLVVFGLASFLYCLYFFNRFIQTGSLAFQLFSALLFSVSFVTELFPTLLIFLLIYPCGTIWDRIKAAKYHFLILFIFAYFYLSFKSDVQTYPLQMGWRAINAWIIYSYYQIYNLYDFGLVDFLSLGISRSIKVLTPILLIIYIFNINRIYIEKNKTVISLYIIGWWFLLSAWINVPVALVVNYQNWVSEGSKSYLYSGLSNFCLSIALGLLALRFFTKTKWPKTYLAALTVVVGLISISHGIESYRAYKQQRYSHERWVFIDEMARAKRLQNSVCYVAPWLFEPNTIVTIRTPNYWDEYVLKNWGQSVRIIQNPGVTQCQLYENLIDPRAKPI